MKYRFLLGSWIFNNNVDHTLDSILKQKITIGIKYLVSITQYYSKATFTDGTEYQFWNGNRYYSWLNEGVFVKDDKILYKYSSGRPTVKTMYLFKELLKNYKFI